MIKTVKVLKIVLCLALVSAVAAGCGPPETITDAITEEEFNQEEFLCQDSGLQADFQPGKMVCTGTIDGKQIVAEIIAEVVEGEGRFRILHLTADGEDLVLEELTDLNVGLAQEAFVPEEGYAVTSIVITDSELTITQSLK